MQPIIRYGGLVYANTDKTKRLELEIETRIPFFTSAGWIQPLNYGFNQFMDSIAELIQSLIFISGGWIQLLNTLERSTIIEPILSRLYFLVKHCCVLDLEKQNCK